ncbi:MAG: alcohol dehydrogenase catalytic domain-containing protein [Gemmatimonadetes bacterium]|nr:alcohol dehydrogenase catalytic domain-containing protein [Gemmatimonadota bacterium]
MLVRVSAQGICGSDLHPYFGRERGLDVCTVMGHELVGEIVEAGEPHLVLAPGEIHDRNLTYSGGRCPARHYLPASLRLAQRDADLIGALISHRLLLCEGVEAYRMFAECREGCRKVVLIPS